MHHLHTPTQSALVILSGGQDSTTSLFWAKQQFKHVEAVTFDYGQRNRIEIESAKKIARLAEVTHHILPINTFSALGGNALTDPNIAVAAPTHTQTALPNTFVAGRNLIFLTFAAALAYKIECEHLVIGVAQVDYSGYPDCRETTLTALELALNLGIESRMKIHAPLMFLTKADSIILAQSLGAFEALAWSHSCYEGHEIPCGVCVSCKLRARGFNEAGVDDPLLARLKLI